MKITYPFRIIVQKIPVLADFTRKGLKFFKWIIKFQLCKQIQARYNFLRKNKPYNLKTEDFPNLFASSFKPNSKIAVVVHVFWPEIWAEIASYLQNFPESFDLFISLVKNKSDTLKESISTKYPGAVVEVFPNHGRDIYPFIHFINTEVFNNYELVCKLHTKKSLHLANGEQWRRNLFDSLVGSPDIINQITNVMRNDPNVGMVGSCKITSTSILEWGRGNRKIVNKLIKKLNLDLDIRDGKFIVGSMFWIKPIILNKIQALNLSANDFEIEDGQLDGTLAHVCERLFNVLAMTCRMQCIETSCTRLHDN